MDTLEKLREAENLLRQQRRKLNEAKRAAGVNLGGHPSKPLDQHLRDGTYRRDRHGPTRELAKLCFKPAPIPRTKCGDPAKWVRNAADEYAVSQGCYFDEARAAYVAEWFRKFLRHSKGDWAGDPFELLDWQREDVIYPLFGWLGVNGRRRFEVTYIELPKKNGKSTTASGIGLYMLCGDGEQGAEVYSCATDRDQAGIVHGEAINMIEASPELDAALKINRTTRNITYEETKSYYRAVSAKPAGKEGLNGNCCICDELHVWYGDELWNALKFMGRSRSEPLRFVITTAGDDPESVCHQQYEYAKKVLDGSVQDEGSLRFFTYIRELSPDEDYGTSEARHKANPSMGITIDEARFIADQKEAERTPSSLASYLRYSFNIWASGTNPWINLADWDECQAEFPDLEQLDCWLGLDLSKTRDTTAAVFVFADKEDEEACWIKPYFWLPEMTAEEQANRVQWPTWAKQGHITLTSGNSLDYARLQRELLELCEQWQPRKLLYDPYYADELTYQLELAGHDRESFAQTLPNFAGVCAEFERLVLQRKIHHDGQAVLRWQVGNVQAKTDANGNKRPVKPEGRDHRKIDGVVAMLMGLSGCLKEREKESVYTSQGITVL